MALTQGDLQAIGALLEPINKRLDKVEKRLQAVEESVQVVRESQITFVLVHIPKITAALDGHKLNSEKLDDIKNNLEEITPTVQALDILHQTGYAK